MITDEELQSLPEDPDQAFAKFEQIARTRLFEALRNAQGYESEALQLEYMNQVVGAANAFGIEGVRDLKVPVTNSFVYNHYADFLRQVDNYTIQIRIHAVGRSRRYSVALDGPTKLKVRHYIAQIKGLIESAGLPADKKDALLRKLSSFVDELDRTRTTFQAVAEMWLAFCGVVGEGFEKLEPARKWLDSIANVMGKAKELEDLNRPRLPGPEERPRLEPPRKDSSTSKSPDDEMPF
jgi:hypothetical protein